MRRISSVLFVLFIALGVTPLERAHASEEAPIRPSPVLSDIHATEDIPQANLETRLLQSLKKIEGGRHFVKEINPILLGAECVCDLVRTVQDRTGDGVGEILVATYSQLTYEVFTDLELLDGTTRESIFKKEAIPGAAFAVAAKVGDDGRPGLLVISLDMYGGYAKLQQLSALDADGSTMWVRNQASIYEYLAGSEARSMQALAVGDLLEGPATDVVVAGSAQLARYRYQASEKHLFLEVLDGSDGLPRTIYQRPGHFQWVEVEAFTDGGVSQILLETHRYSSGDLEMVNAVTGVTMWRHEVRRSWYWGWVTVDILQNPGKEVIVYSATSRRSTWDILDPLDGSLLDSRISNGTRIADDADRNGLDDFIFEGIAGENSQSIQQDLRRESGGRTLWRRSLRSTTRAQYVDYTYTSISNAGDFDSDGVQELSVGHSYYVDWGDDGIEGAGQTRFLLDGKNGGALGMKGEPLRASLDGDGDDLLQRSIRGENLRLTGTDGKLGTNLWEQIIEPRDPPRSKGCYRWIYPLEKGDRVDLLVVIRGTDRDEELLLDGLTGEVLWRH
jgi:hypothetical protein